MSGSVTRLGAGARLAPAARIGIVLLLLGVGCGGLKRCAYEGFGRDDWQQRERVVEVLGLRPGQVVADIGAGGGYFTFLLADAVGPEGRVYAVDVDPDMTGHLESEAAERRAQQVTVVLAEPDDPGLPEAGVDLVFTVNTFHHFEDPAAYFTTARSALRPGGRVAVLDYREGQSGSPFGEHATPRAAVVEALEAAGFTLVEEHDFIERQNFLVFAAPEAG